MDISLTRSVRRKDERGESLMGIMMGLSSGLMILVGAIALPTVFQDAWETKAWGNATSVLEDKCNLKDVQLDLNDSDPSEKQAHFTSSSNVSANYTLEAVGVNLVVRDGKNELCTVPTDLQDFR